MSNYTKHPLAIPVANFFRVIAPNAPHKNKKEGMCPPYPWFVVCEAGDDENVEGEAAANMERIVLCWNACMKFSNEALREMAKANQS